MYIEEVKLIALEKFYDLADPEFKRLWFDYHLENARLRLTTDKANMAAALEIEAKDWHSILTRPKVDIENLVILPSEMSETLTDYHQASLFEWKKENMDERLETHLI